MQPADFARLLRAIGREMDPLAHCLICEAAATQVRKTENTIVGPAQGSEHAADAPRCAESYAHIVILQH